MHIDSTAVQPHRINDPFSQQQAKEVPGEKEPDGDWDDMTEKASMTSRNAPAPAAPQVNPQGMGTRIDILA